MRTNEQKRTPNSERHQREGGDRDYRPFNQAEENQKPRTETEARSEKENPGYALRQDPTRTKASLELAIEQLVCHATASS